MINFLTSWWFIGNLLLGILLIEFALSKSKAVRKLDEARDSKYPAFRRTDIKNWNRVRLYFGAPLVVPKFMMSLIAMTIFSLLTKIFWVATGYKEGD
jgi:hypothetical protein